MSVKVVLLNTGEVFNTMKEASITTGAPYTTLCLCCQGIRQHSGTMPNGEKMKWCYLEDYKGGELDVESMSNL